MNNINYLFAANIIVWIALFSYIYSLVRKNAKLFKEIEFLKKSFSNSSK
jgi:CcmD family protein|tara:strand:- start:360 stop:506 length:147 start_codon:yes stop_codon:yes gene_type:complete